MEVIAWEDIHRSYSVVRGVCAHCAEWERMCEAMPEVSDQVSHKCPVWGYLVDLGAGG